VLNYGATNVGILRKTNPSSLRGGHPIPEHINGLGMNTNFVMGLDGARNQKRLCWQRKASSNLLDLELGKKDSPEM
jgi:hypothetical protein